MKTPDIFIQLSYESTDFLFSRHNVCASLFVPDMPENIPDDCLIVPAAASGIQFGGHAICGIRFDNIAAECFGERISAVPRLALVLVPDLVNEDIVVGEKKQKRHMEKLPDQFALISSAQPRIFSADSVEFTMLAGIPGNYLVRHGIAGFRFLDEKKLQVLLDLPVFLSAAEISGMPERR